MRQVTLPLLAIVLLTQINISAQGVDERAKDRAEDKANQRVDTRIDQGLDKGLDAIEGLFKKKKKKSSDKTNEDNSEYRDEPDNENESVVGTDHSGGAGVFGSMFEPAEWEDSYNFDFRSKAHLTSTDKKNKVEESDMEWMMSEDAFSMILRDPNGKDPEAKIIFDYKNHSFVTLSEENGEKRGMAIAMNKDQLSAAIAEGVEEEEMTGDGSFIKTGRTKSILGYTCSEYTFTDEDVEGVMWMTSELEVEMNNIYNIMTSGSSKKSNLPDNYPQGYVMEMENKNTKKNETHHYIVTELETDANITLSLDSYNVTDPIGMMHSGKK